MPSNTFTDKKYLVVMIKDGGEDSYNTLISRQPDHVAAVLAERPTMGFTQAELDNTYASAKLAGTAFSLHPALQPLQAAWNAGEMAITHRVGTMFTNIADIPIGELRLAASPFYTGPIQFPWGLGGHDQAYRIGSMITREFVDATGAQRFLPGEGFLGRLATRFNSYAGTSTLPMSLVCNRMPASSFIVTDGLTQPLTLPLVGGDFRRDGVGSSTQTRALSRLDTIMAETRVDPRMEAFRVANVIAKESVGFLQPVIEGAAGRYSVDQDFANNPVSGWQGIMRTFARTIEEDLRNPTLRSRTIFVGGLSGYDTHTAEGKMGGRMAALHADWSTSVAGFRLAMIRLGVWNNTLIIDNSEMSRSLTENGSSGVDHAYARDSFAFGGAVRGRGKQGSSGLFGTYPSVISATGTGSFDLTGGQAAGGALAPGVSLEQYWDAPLRWFGADSSDIAVVLPRRNVFGPSVGLIA